MDVARKGNSCHPNCSIAEGDPEVLINGDPVAFEGRETTGGAKPMPIMPTMPARARP